MEREHRTVRTVEKDYMNKELMFHEIKELCKANGLAIDKIANDTGINQNYVAELFMQTMRMILNNMKGK